MTLPAHYFQCVDILRRICVNKPVKLPGEMDAQFIAFQLLRRQFPTAAIDEFFAHSEFFWLSEHFFANNSYLQNIKIPADGVRVGKLTLETAKPNGRYVVEPCIQASDGHVTFAGYDGDNANHFLLKTDNNVVITAVSPKEMLTTAPAIKEAKGDVLCMGLGLGYFAYMAHLKSGVKSITIAEDNPYTIELFKTYILPQFNHPEKIQIVPLSDFVYVDVYDFVFINFYDNSDEGVPAYMNMLRAGMVEDKISYWMEDALLYKLSTTLGIDSPISREDAIKIAMATEK